MASEIPARGGGDAFDLQRFVGAQARVWADVIAELERGRKTSHWMWFVFPQLRGLGHSAMAQRFGIASRGEAAAYLAHAVLGVRLVTCTRLMLSHRGSTALQILGSPDDVKFVSSMTLFASIDGADAAFAQALAPFNAGRRDARTLDMLAAADGLGPYTHR